jgi:Zn-dependent peptidase ImmA (M78 family)
MPVIKPQRIRAVVERLLEEPTAGARPLQIDRLIASQGITLVRKSFDDDHDVSGFYLNDAGRQFIGVNAAHAVVRQRFTMAHELGHALLLGAEGLHLDQAFKLRFRDDASSTGIDPDEVAANRFAAELLMPSHEVVDMASGLDVNDDAAIRQMARHFGVSQHAMSIRLNVLGAQIDGSARF